MKLFSATVADRYNDPAEVFIEDALSPHVYLDVTEDGKGSAELSLTPKQARRLAKALRKAAKIAKENA